MKQTVEPVSLNLLDLTVEPLVVQMHKAVPF